MIKKITILTIICNINLLSSDLNSNNNDLTADNFQNYCAIAGKIGTIALHRKCVCDFDEKDCYDDMCSKLSAICTFGCISYMPNSYDVQTQCLLCCFPAASIIAAHNIQKLIEKHYPIQSDHKME